MYMRFFWWADGRGYFFSLTVVRTIHAWCSKMQTKCTNLNGVFYKFFSSLPLEYSWKPKKISALEDWGKHNTYLFHTFFRILEHYVRVAAHFMEYCEHVWGFSLPYWEISGISDFFCPKIFMCHNPKKSRTDKII